MRRASSTAAMCCSAHPRTAASGASGDGMELRKIRTNGTELHVALDGAGPPVLKGVPDAAPRF